MTKDNAEVIFIFLKDDPMGMYIEDKTIGTIPDYAAPYAPLFPVAHAVGFDRRDEPGGLKKLGERVQKRRDAILDRLDIDALPYKTRLQLSEELDVIDKVQLDPNGLRKLRLASYESLSSSAPMVEATPETVFPGLIEKDDRSALKTLAGLTDAAFRKRLESDLAVAQKTLRDDFDHGSMTIAQRDDIREQIHGIQSALSDRYAFKQLRADVAQDAAAPPLPGARFDVIFGYLEKSEIASLSAMSDKELKESLQFQFDRAKINLQLGVDSRDSPDLDGAQPKNKRQHQELMHATHQALNDPKAFARLREEMQQRADALNAVPPSQDAKTLGSKYLGTTPTITAPVPVTPQNAPLPTIAPAPSAP